jgi:hypothetical protein
MAYMLTILGIFLYSKNIYQVLHFTVLGTLAVYQFRNKRFYFFFLEYLCCVLIQKDINKYQICLQAVLKEIMANTVQKSL